MWNVIIVGAGAAGLFCARAAVKRGLRVLVLESQDTPARKVAACGGGYGNFSNTEISAKHYFSHNPHFVLSGLKRFPTQALLQLLRADGFDYELRENCYFCTEPIQNWMKKIVSDLMDAGVEFQLNTRVKSVTQSADVFCVNETLQACQVVLACGGRAYPQLGGTFEGMKLAKSLGLNITDTMPGLAPIRFPASLRTIFAELQGIALDKIKITAGGQTFEGSLVFRPDGIGGIAVFKAASAWAWNRGPVTINFVPNFDIAASLAASRQAHGTALVRNCVSQFLARRLVLALLRDVSWAEKTISQLKKEEFNALVDLLTKFTFTPENTGDFSEAEVMMGGVDTTELSSKTFESQKVPGLYIAGEMMDVTGQLGGYNLHWAFATGTLIGQALSLTENKEA